MAAKTLVGAVDAATASNPNAPARGTETAAPERAAGSDVVEPVRPARAAAESAGARAARAAAGARQTGRGLKQGGRRFGEAVWGPFVRLSGVLWLEVTGVFFGLFALSAGVGAWKLRGAWRGAPGDHEAQRHMLVAAGVALVFGYFCLTSFLKARRRERAR